MKLRLMFEIQAWNWSLKLKFRIILSWCFSLNFKFKVVIFGFCCICILSCLFLVSFAFCSIQCLDLVYLHCVIFVFCQIWNLSVRIFLNSHFFRDTFAHTWQTSKLCYSMLIYTLCLTPQDTYTTNHLNDSYWVS